MNWTDRDGTALKTNRLEPANRRRNPLCHLVPLCPDDEQSGNYAELQLACPTEIGTAIVSSNSSGQPRTQVTASNSCPLLRSKCKRPGRGRETFPRLFFWFRPCLVSICSRCDQSNGVKVSRLSGNNYRPLDYRRVANPCFDCSALRQSDCNL